VAVVAELGVGAVALLADAGVPVVRRCRCRVARDAAAERIDAGRLIEVAVDDEPAAAHAGCRHPDQRRELLLCPVTIGK
jgi:hypothetical protein